MSISCIFTSSDALPSCPNYCDGLIIINDNDDSIDSYQHRKATVRQLNREMGERAV